VFLLSREFRHTARQAQNPHNRTQVGHCIEENVVDSDPGLVAFLREHKLASKHSQDTDYVFCTESGRPLHFRNLGKAFTKAADKAKLNQAEVARKLRFHDLRRTFASILNRRRL
jgi:integrase